MVERGPPRLESLKKKLVVKVPHAVKVGSKLLLFINFKQIFEIMWASNLHQSGARLGGCQEGLGETPISLLRINYLQNPESWKNYQPLHILTQLLCICSSVII